MIAYFSNMALAIIAGAMFGLCVTAVAAEPDMNVVNAMDRAAFVEKFGGIPCSRENPKIRIG